MSDEQLDRNDDNLVFDIFSHEINNQLSSIGSALDLIALVGQLNERQTHFLQRAEAGLTHLKTTVDSFMYFAKSSDGMDLDYSVVHFGHMVERVIDLFSVELSYKSITVDLDVDADLKIVSCDEALVMHVVQNLIINAIKYKKGDGVDIKIRVTGEDHCVRLDIQDNGIGIPSDEISKIFDRYYRVPDQPVKVKGHGLGLAIAKLIITEHGGRIWVNSVVGEGSTFSFTIPYHHVAMGNDLDTGFGVARVSATESMDDVDDNIQESKPMGEDSPRDSF